MNVQEKSEIRELATAEADAVTGGSIIVNTIRAAWTHALSVALMNTDMCPASGSSFADELSVALNHPDGCEK